MHPFIGRAEFLASIEPTKPDKLNKPNKLMKRDQPNEPSDSKDLPGSKAIMVHHYYIL